MLTLDDLPIRKFMKENYTPALEKYLDHMFYVRIRSKNICGK